MLLLAGHVAASRFAVWEAEAPCRLLSGVLGVAAALLWTTRSDASPRSAFRRGAGAGFAAASLLLAGATLGIEASRDQAPAEVHPAASRVELEGFVADVVGASASRPTLVFDVERVRVGDRERVMRARVAARWPGGSPPPTWAAAGTALRLKGALRPPEDARNPGGYAPRGRLARAGIAATIDVDPDGVTAWSPPRDQSALRRTPWRPLLAAGRRAIADRFEAAAGPRAAALARGMLLGDRGGIEPDMRMSFRNAGTLHILSISGLHVCLIAGFLAAGARALGLGAAGAMSLELAGLALYVLFVGAPPPALRSALLWTLSRGSRLVGRGSNALAGWGAAGLVLHLAAPTLLHELGFALSFGAVLGLHAGAAIAPGPVPGAEGSRLRRARRALLAGIAAGAGASIGTLPVEATSFGSIPVMGPIANLAVIPLTGLFLAESILVAVAAWIAPVPVVELLGSALDGLAFVLTTVNDALGGRVEPFALHVVPSLGASAVSWTALLAAACLGGGRAMRGNRGRRAVAALLLAVAAIAPVVALPPSTQAGPAPDVPPTLLLLDVGQGDAAILLGGDGGAVLVDAGPRGAFRDEGRLTVEPALRAEGVRRVVAAVSSHGHRDHE